MFAQTGEQTPIRHPGPFIHSATNLPECEKLPSFTSSAVPRFRKKIEYRWDMFQCIHCAAEQIVLQQSFGSKTKVSTATCFVGCVMNRARWRTGQATRYGKSV